MHLSRRQARRLAKATLSTLYERRPFKWDLNKLEFDEPEMWREVLRDMENDVIAAAKRMRIKRKR